MLAGPGEAHRYLMHVGIGWAVARLPAYRHSLLERLDPLLRWLVFDGYGFHEGYFHPLRGLVRRRVPRRLAGYARRAFDQGLGRSLWFVEGGDGERIAAAVAGFPGERRGDLWSGVGLACAYAGGVEWEALQLLSARSGGYAPYLAQGAAFAAEARQHAGNPAAHTEMACRLLCGLDARQAAALVRAAGHELPADGELPAYEIWRQRLTAQLTREGKAA